jgi:putative drug exporter of the RND superfamily
VTLGQRIYKFRGVILLAWIAVAALLALCVRTDDATVGETTDLLPNDTPVHIALTQLADHFGDKSGLSTVAIVFERPDQPLTDADLQFVEDLAKKLVQPDPTDLPSTDLVDLTLRSPAALAFAGNDNPLISPDRKAALISISLPYNYITKQAAKIVKHVQQVVAENSPPPGMAVAVTGSAGYGYDYAIATQRSHHKTLIVTLISVIIILLLVYRAPIAAVMPLLGISLAAIVVLKLLEIGARFGVHSGTAEQIFTFVLLYGGGVDYSLLFMSRHREFLDLGHNSADSIALALDASLSTIFSSAVMTVSGLAMFCFARFSIFRHAGPAVVLALIVAALAATTLVPAIIAMVGPLAFWPHKPSTPNEKQSPQSRRIWPAIASVVVRRPILIMSLTLLVLLPPALRGFQIPWTYDSLSSLKSNYSARQGSEIVQRHWPTGEIAPVTILAVADQAMPENSWTDLSNSLVAQIRTASGVDNIRAMATPLGLQVAPAKNAAVLLLAHDKVTAEFLSPDHQAMRLSIILNVPPLISAAMADVSKIAATANKVAATSALNPKIYVTGATAEMIDIRAVTQADFYRVATLTLVVILIVVVAVLRDFLLSIFILAATLLSYFATLGLTLWIFNLLGATELEWKVQMLLFIVLVAVGQDYSIFFALRYAQESRHFPRIQAIERTLIFTGPVISSCGLIMAATLGSIMAGDIKLLIQLGFAFALGMLLDTFLVRPLLLPTFIILTHRSKKTEVPATA